MVYLWCTKCEKRYNQKKLNRKSYLSNMLIFTDSSHNGLYRFSLWKNILVEIEPDNDWQRVRETMEKSGYICMSVSDTRMSFNKGYTPKGYADKVFHIHFHRTEDNDEILFRDYLIDHPEAAKEYERLKISLLPEYRHDRDGYTDAKSEFVSNVVELAKNCKLLRPL